MGFSLRSGVSLALGLLLLALLPAAAAAQLGAEHSLRAPLTGERFYFVMTDRFENGSTENDLGGLPADRLQSGFDPSAKGFYHGGDLAGLRQRLAYIRGLGTTAIWLTPSFKNKAVQLEDGPSAGYHGYWITDFTQIDPHLGTNGELAALIDEAHDMGMKVFFDIITNHTADVIDYEEAHRPAYVSKDEEPYRSAAGEPFDDVDFAGQPTFPPLSAEVSFPFTPFIPEGQPVKVPDWLNDPTLYHNRGNSTFVGENALYGDFSGLDDLFTEHPTVVQGMIDIYEAWIRDFGIDGFRIDTMKHVDDAFWQRFAPEVLDFAHSVGKQRFFMFGEVFDTARPFTSHFTTHDRVQAVLDFPFQKAAQDFAAGSHATTELRDFFVADDWYTDADSNAYQLPTFLGNHDMGRFGRFVTLANPGAGDAERLARVGLGHALMYLSRGNPVVYYGDEQGFTGDGGDQDARQDMFPSHVASYNDDDLIGTDATTAQDNFDESHPLYRAIADLADLRATYGALRNGMQQHRVSSDGPGIYAFSRMDRVGRREFVVALNNATQAQTATIPTYSADAVFRRVYGRGGAGRVTTAADKSLRVTVGPLSAVVYRAAQRLPLSSDAPSVAIEVPDELRDRAEIRATVSGDGPAEVSFFARDDENRISFIGTDDNAPYRVFHDVSDFERAARISKIDYVAVVQDNAGHQQRSAVRSGTLVDPLLTFEAPAEGARVRGAVELRAVAKPDKPSYMAIFERQIGTDPFTEVGRDSSQPVYTAFDDTTGLPNGTIVHYRARLFNAEGRLLSETPLRSVEVVTDPVTTAVVHYNRSDGDYADWGLHLFGDAIADGVATEWTAPRQRAGIDAFGAFYEIPLKDDTARVGFIMHRPAGDTVPDTREPGGDRFFVPLEHPEIWLRQGDPTVYFSPPA
jgi:alpha-amylase